MAAQVIVNSLAIETSVTAGATTMVAVPLINASTTSLYGWRLNPRDPWLTIPQANGTLAPRATAQIPVQISAARLQAGTYVGRLQFLSGAFVQNIFVTAHITPAPAQITIVNGNNAAGMPGSVLPALQVSVTDANQNPVTGIAVTFSVTTGGGSVSVPTAFTNNAGIATTVLTLPSSPGVVQVVASSGALSVTFTLTAVNAPSIAAASIVDGVTFNAYASLGPGSIVSIGGQNLAQTTIAAGSGELPLILGATQVLLVTATNTIPLPLLSISPTQITAQVPTDVSPGTYSLRVASGTALSSDIPLTIAAFDPGILTQDGTGHGQGIFIKSDGSTVSTSNPADRGSTITFFAVGLGAVNPPLSRAGQTGALSEPFNRTVAVPNVFFDIYSASVIYSGLPAGAPTPYQVTVQVPAQLTPATNISVSLMIGGFGSNRVTIPVR
jgi:uncharacterized protein (TIGR03437 family)